jgi:hypothetical protein
MKWVEHVGGLIPDLNAQWTNITVMSRRHFR